MRAPTNRPRTYRQAKTALLTVLVFATAAGGSDWPRFLGPDGDGRSPETGIRTDWSAGAPPVAWWVEAGEGYAIPTVADGRLFHFDRHGDRARLTCFDARTGKEHWRSEYPPDYSDYYGYSNGPRSSPVVDGDRVYTFGVEGRLRCHRVTDGELLWEIDTTAEFGVVQNFFGVGSSPVVEGPLLLTMIGGSPPGSPKIHSGQVKGNGSAIVAFDKLNGKVRYRFGDELASYSTLSVASMHGRRKAFAFTRGGLLGFDPIAGREEFFVPWRAKVLESVNAATPVVIDDTVFVSETYGPGSLLLRVPGSGDPTVVWKDGRRDQSLQTHWNTPIYHDGYLYASSGRNSGDAELRAVEHATGKVAWSQPGLKRATLLYVDGHLVVLGEYGLLQLIEATPERYKVVSETDLSERTLPGNPKRSILSYPAWGPPVLSHGLLYVRGKDTLVALDLSIPAATTRDAGP